MSLKHHDFDYYLRMDKMPHIFCPGCGHGIAMQSIIRAIDDLELERDKTVIISGIGCSSRIPGYLDFNTLHTTHGRALAFATGIKMANPELNVLVVSGDGDATAIGGNHFIHACRRNIGITAVVVNNYTYGMTGGQVSPTTPQGDRATTAPYGNVERPFDISGLAVAAGANFVARTSVYHADRLEEFLLRGIRKKGFSVVETLTPCPTCYGRRNRHPSGVDLLEIMREQAERPPRRWDRLLGRGGAFGVLADRDAREHTEVYADVVERARR